MDAERLKQTEEIYHAALEIPALSREDFIKESCGGDENLRREVESLLSFDKTYDRVIDVPPESLVAEMFAAKDKQIDLTGKEIGHYKIVKLLGRGGMGAVYLAADAKLDRKVALKILPDEFAEDENRMNRFVREAINFYVEATRTGNVEALKEGFHEQAILCGYPGDELIAAPI